ncbi:MAG: hypothetical protein HY040_27360 [Planctomycetes bacterium]|nr:hypothetical protein [Planctomycetota bacterium]
MRCILSILLVITSVQSAQCQEKPFRIPVVTSWEELRALKAIDVGNGVKIRLGVERDEIPQWSGGLLYCLAENYTPTTKGNGKMPFGPVHAKFTCESEHFPDRFDDAIIKDVRWENGRKEPKGSYLYVRALPISRVGIYHVTVSDREAKLLAEARVKGTKDFFHPWMPWLEGFDDPVAPWEGIALPTINRLGPIAFIEPGKTKKGVLPTLLPTLLPTDEKPSLTIKMEGKEIVIRAESSFTTSRPHYHFLARWWVNGEPFVPKQAETLWDFLGYGRVSEEKELRLEFKFRPERLDAKRGDKIGLQLMHAEGEWSWCAETSQGKSCGAALKDGCNIRVSNRIEFDVPKKEVR